MEHLDSQQPETMPVLHGALPGAASVAGESTPQVEVEVFGRTLKYVLTIQPKKGLGYRAILALGSDGCDPLMRSIEVLGWPDLFEAMRGLLADAETQWHTAPRYPTAPGKTKAAPTRREASSTPAISVSTDNASPTLASDVPSAPPPPLERDAQLTPQKTPTGQLSLFSQ